MTLNSLLDNRESSREAKPDFEYAADMSESPRTETIEEETRRDSPRPPQQARARRTRQKLIEAAIECFEQQGFDDTTTAMIAARAGVAVGTFYNHFTDKREIIFELLEQTNLEVEQEVVAQLDPASWRGITDPRERTRTLIDAIFHAQRLRPGIQRILWAQFFRDDEFRAPFETMRERIRRAIEEFIQALDESGLGRADLDREMAAFVVLNAVQWNSAQTYLSGDPEFTNAAAHATADLVARYLFVDVGPEEA